MRAFALLLVCLISAGCGSASDSSPPVASGSLVQQAPPPSASPSSAGEFPAASPIAANSQPIAAGQAAEEPPALPNRPASASFPTRPPGVEVERETLVSARRGFVTRIVKPSRGAGPADDPTGSGFELVRYPSPVGDLVAYVTAKPADGQRHPAIVWITGGDCNSIGDIWSEQDRSNQQGASAFREAGIVMMFPSLRGGNDIPGQREGFLGEVDDVLAATDYLAKMPHVDPDQIYLGGHSTGGTLVMLVAASSNRYRAVFSLGPVAAAAHYGGQFVYCDSRNRQEMRLRSPREWLHCVERPLYVFEAAGSQGNWTDSIEAMARENSNPQVRFFPVPGLNHFSVIAPVTEFLARQIVAGEVRVTTEDVKQMR